MAFQSPLTSTQDPGRGQLHGPTLLHRCLTVQSQLVIRNGESWKHVPLKASKVLKGMENSLSKQCQCRHSRYSKEMDCP